MAEGEIVNRVAKSGLITVNPEELLPEFQISSIDIKEYLFKGLILREKDFREELKEKDWQPYENTHVAVFCSADAIVPLWAYMLVATHLTGAAKQVHFGTVQEVEERLLLQFIENLEVAEYDGRRVVIKGCSKRSVPPSVYVALTNKLLPRVKALMFGEPCSTVPVFKRS